MERKNFGDNLLVGAIYISYLKNKK